MPAAIRLISTDFDGTLIGHPGDGRCVPPLAKALADFKSSGGLWALNTGRSLDHAIEGVEVFRAPVEPDFLLTHEREIYRRDAAGRWSDFGEWNAVCRERHAKLFHANGEVFARIRRALEGLRDLNFIDENGHTSGLITSDEAAMAQVARALDLLRGEIPEFNYQRNTIYLRFCHSDYHKGASLGELSRRLGLRAEEVFAAGDHFNDLPMLDPRYARHLACPANAIPQVKAAVRAAAGHISEKLHGEGIAQALGDAMAAPKTNKPAAVC